VDRLRRARDDRADGEVVALAASDPANPFGWLLPWPELFSDGGRRGGEAAPERSRPEAARPEPQAQVQGARRASGTVVVLVDGRPVVFLDRNGRRLRSFADVSEEQLARALPALRDVARGRPRGALTLERINDEAAIRSPLLPALERAGFRQDYRYLRVNA
jgi:ATP-dependent Lhr-like helicase